MAKVSATSRGWLAFFGLIQCVLLPLFAVGLGLTLTLGTPNRVATELTRGHSRVALAQMLNREVLASAKANGLLLQADTTVVTPAQTASLTRQTVAASADFKRSVATAALAKTISTQVHRAASRQHLQLPAKQWQVLDAALTKKLDTEMTALMQSGVGAAYGMVVLVLQTMTIVTAVIGVINLALMRLTAHSWRRWLRVVGRITYVIGLLGGAATLGAAVPALSAGWRFGGSPAGVVPQLIQAFAPAWQHTAGWVIVIGLVLAGAAYLLPRKDNKL